MLHHNIKGFVGEGEFIQNYSFGPKKPRLWWESFFHTPLPGLNVIAIFRPRNLLLQKKCFYKIWRKTCQQLTFKPQIHIVFSRGSEAAGRAVEELEDPCIV